MAIDTQAYYRANFKQ